MPKHINTSKSQEKILHKNSRKSLKHINSTCTQICMKKYAEREREREYDIPEIPAVQ